MARGRTIAAGASGRAPADRRSRAVFVFPGQGGQWPGMARELLAAEPEFRSVVVQCAEAIERIAGWNLLDALSADAPPTTIDYVQPALFAIGVGLSVLWRSWGVEPAMVIGHSMGEVAAAHVAGALSLDDAARVICHRSRLLLRISGKGTMATVELPLREARAALHRFEDRLAVAANNSARSTVISGDPQAIEDMLLVLRERGVFCRLVNVDVASHSPQVDCLRDDLRAELTDLAPRRANVPMLSTVEVRPVDGAELDAEYWIRNLRETVRLSEAVRQLIRENYSTFIELGPHPVLLPAIASELTAAASDAVAVPSLRRHGGERATLLASLAQVYVSGHSVRWTSLYSNGGRAVSLPTYPWQRERYWLDQVGTVGGGSGPAPRAGAAGHPLLQRRTDRAGTPRVSLWEADIGADDPAYLSDHRVGGHVVMPASAYLDAVLAAVRMLESNGIVLEDVVFEQLLVARTDERRTVQIQVSLDGVSGWFAVFSRAAGGEGEWVRHARGRLVAHTTSQAPTVIPGALLDRLDERIDAREHYRALSGRGLEHGPSFRAVAEAWRGDGEALARLAPPAVLDGGYTYLLHPALLDAALQVLSVLAPDSDRMLLPVAIEHVAIDGRPTGELWARATLRPGNETRGDVTLLDGDGRCVAWIEGLLVRSVEGHQATDTDWLYELAWREASQSPISAKPSMQVLVVADRNGDASQLAKAFEARGANCTVTSPARAEILLGRDRTPWRAVVLLNGDFMTALELVQVLVGVGTRDVPRLWPVTRGAQLKVEAPVAAQLWGLGRTVAYEHPELRCTLVDLGPEATEDETGRLADELLADGTENQVVLRGERRLVARLQPAAWAAEGSARGPAIRGRAGPLRLESDRPGVLERIACGRTGQSLPARARSRSG